jgi:hypothetical protein
MLLLFQMILLIIALIVFIKRENKQYKDGAYYQITKHPYLSVRFDKGKYGEYLTYKYLKNLE